MALAPGTRLGPFEVTALLGAGGMGEVYRATDTNLKRQVALKVLPAAVANDPDRLARFRREAEVLAALNHPNIAQIFGLEKTDGTLALVMELVDGPTLSDRVAKGALPIDDALAMAKQIAEALETAHEQGIIHRDLKPANIKVRDDGTVKVLDFGLAKALEPAGALSPGLSQSPTMTTPAMTQAGVILGTAAYMSPEQAKGHAADKRADIWAFGCVLYEMLTGRQAFQGETVSDLVASILRAEPEWSLLPPVPGTVRSLLQHCLRKDARRRLQHIGDARIVFEEPADNATPAIPAPNRASMRLMPWKVATLTLLVAMFVLVARQLFREPSSETRVTQFLVSPPEKGTFESGIGGAENWPFPALSPDGLRLAFTARESSRGVMLWVRSWDSTMPRALSGTEGAGAPFWSPDSRSLAFFAKGKLKRVDAAGGPVRDVCDAEFVARGGAWNRDGVILFAGNGGPLYRVASSGGKPVAATDLSHGQTSHRTPTFLPDGRHFLFFAGGGAGASGLYVGTLDSKEYRQLPLMTDSGVVYSPSGHLLFTRQGILLYQPFDMRTLETTGEPKPVAEQIAYFAGLRAFSVSDKGDLAFWSDAGTSDSQLTWVDRTGKVIDTVGVAGNYRGVDLSPDGRLLVHSHDASGGDIFLFESPRGPMTRLTFDASQHNSSPVWSPDGSRFVFQSLRNSKWGIYQRLASGAGGDERIVESDVNTVPLAWSPDKRSIIFWWLRGGTSLWTVRIAGGTDPSLLRSSSSSAQFSADGKWLAYTSAERGASEVYAQPVESSEQRLQVSPKGGNFPRWRQDGKELFYITTFDRRMVAIEVSGSGSNVKYGSPIELFEVGAEAATSHSGGPFHFYAVSPDGQRFLVPRSTSRQVTATAPITVIHNWTTSIGR